MSSIRRPQPADLLPAVYCHDACIAGMEHARSIEQALYVLFISSFSCSRGLCMITVPYCEANMGRKKQDEDGVECSHE